jgi:hypothetical protein
MKTRSCYKKILKLIILGMMASVLQFQGYAQKSNELRFPERKIGLSIGFSQHQKQSIGGVFIEAGQEMKLSKKLLLYNNFGFTMHTGIDPKHDMVVTNIPSLRLQDPSFSTAAFRFVTAGIQTSPTLFLNLRSDKIKLGFGPVVRYQTTSWPSDYEFNLISTPTTTRTLYYTNYSIKQIQPHALSGGGRMMIDVHVAKIKKFEARATCSYQVDSNGDRLAGLGIKLQRSYVKLPL